MKVRAYTLAVHAGHAPCWMYDTSQNCDVLTLANCKPLIREVAPLGEWIAGVTPTRMEPRLAYLMQVSERMKRAEYWKRYKDSRFDSIYKPKAKGGWLPLKNPWHWDEESFARDLSSESVLLSENFYVFAHSYSESGTSPSGLKLPAEYCALARGGMRGYGHLIDMPDSFLPWIQEQPRLRLSDFRVIRDFEDWGCGCCRDEPSCSSKCE